MATKNPKKSVKKPISSTKKTSVKKKKDSKAEISNKKVVQNAKTSAKTSAKKAKTSAKTPAKKIQPEKEKKSNLKPVSKSSSKKNPKNSSKMIAFITGLIMIVLLLIYLHVTFISTTGKTDENNSESVFTSYTNNTVLIIEDSTCTLCYIDEFILGIKTEIDPDVNVIKLEYSSEEAQKFIKEFDLNQVPIVLFSTSFESTPIWEQLSVAFNKISYNNNEFYQLTYNTPQIKKILENPQTNEKTISFGNQDSTNIIYEFCSYETALCGLVNGNDQYLEEVLETNPTYNPLIPNIINEDNVKIIVMHVPQEENSQAYIGAFCANEQGKYAQFREMLFNNQFEWVPLENRESIFENYALQVGIKTDIFMNCMDEKKEIYEDQLVFEVNIAQSYELTQFPTFFINNYVISGPLDYESYQNIILE